MKQKRRGKCEKEIGGKKCTKNPRLSEVIVMEPKVP